MTKVNVGIPIIRSTKKVTDIINVGSAYGVLFVATLPETSYSKSISLVCSLQQYQMYGADYFEVRDYFVEAVIARGGISFNSFTERQYRIVDERFSDKTQSEIKNYSFFVNVLYNFDNEYELFQSNSFLLGAVPTYNEIGYVGGMRIATNQFQIILVNIDIELGKYPIYNEALGFGGSCRFGIGLHKVK